MTDKIELEFTEYVIEGVANIKLWGSGHGLVDMKPIKLKELPKDLRDVGYNDGGFGCERIDNIDIEVYKSYQGYLVYQFSDFISLTKKSKQKKEFNYES